MNWPTLKGSLSIVGTTFAAGALGFIEQNFLANGLPSTGAQWQHAAVMALVAGLSAVIHYYQMPPPGGPGSGPKLPGPPAVLATAVLVCLLSGCAGTFDQLVAKSPATIVQQAETVANTVNAGAKAAFELLLPHLPATQQAAAQAAFNKAEATFGDAETAANAALAAYQDGHSANWAALVADIVNGVDAVVACVDTWSGSTPASSAAAGPALLPPAFVTLRARMGPDILTLHRFH